MISFNFSSGESLAIILAIISDIIASLGNITSAYNQKIKLPVIQTNTFAMMYGSLLMICLALILGKSFTFEFSVSYVGSLMYLSVFGSLIAFGSYLTLLGKIGPDKAGYVMLVIPVIAILFSTAFEDYQWSITAVFGVIFITLGNYLVLKKKKSLGT